MSSENFFNRGPTLLVADDEVEIGEIIRAVAEDLGFEVVCVTKGLEVVDLVERLKPDVIALDLRMPGADGVEIIRALGKRKCKSSIILMSGMDQRTLSSVQSLGREHQLDIGSTLTKPMSINAIEGALSPFLSIKKQNSESQTKHTAQLLDYGLSIAYELEFKIKPLSDNNPERLKVVPKWRKDNGEILTGSRLCSWQMDASIGLGLSKMVLDNALETLRIWGNQGFSPVLAFKLDASLLLMLNMPDILAEMVDSYFVPRELVTIEVDEAIVIQKQNSIVDVMSRLRIKGFNLSVCVEGEGEAILPNIDSLPVDNVIIDMEYMSRKSNFLQDMETEFLYSSLTSVSNRKGIAVCAINVDTVDILSFVRRCNFNSARGTQMLTPENSNGILHLYREGKFSEKSATKN